MGFRIRNFKILAWANLVLLSGIGMWKSTELVMAAVAYSRHLNSLSKLDEIKNSDSELEGDVTESREEEKVKDKDKLCLHVNEHKDILLYSTYMSTSLVILYTLVEILVASLLVRLAHDFKKGKLNRSSRFDTSCYFWTSHQILLIISLLIVGVVNLALNGQWDEWETYQVALKFGFLILWKCSVLVYAICIFLHGYVKNEPKWKRKKIIVEKVRARRIDDDEEDLTIHENYESPSTSAP